MKRMNKVKNVIVAKVMGASGFSLCQKVNCSMRSLVRNCNSA